MNGILVDLNLLFIAIIVDLLVVVKHKFSGLYSTSIGLYLQYATHGDQKQSVQCGPITPGNSSTEADCGWLLLLLSTR